MKPNLVRITILLFVFQSFSVQTFSKEPIEKELRILVDSLRTPVKIQVPESIPSYERIIHLKTGNEFTFFPRGRYEIVYFEAWNEQLYQYGALNRNPDSGPTLLNLTPLNAEHYSGRALNDGLVECHRRIAKLHNEHDHSLVRRAALLAYTPPPAQKLIRFSREEQKNDPKNDLKIKFNEK